MKEPFKYFCILVFVCYALRWGYNYYFPTTYVYVDETNTYHSTPTCEYIPGMQVLEEVEEVVGSEKIEKSEVFYDDNYTICNYCYSPLEIENRTNIINRSLK